MKIALIRIGKKIEIFRTDTGWEGNDDRLVRAARAIATGLPAGYYPDRLAAEARYVARALGGEFALLHDPPPAEEGVVY